VKTAPIYGLLGAYDHTITLINLKLSSPLAREEYKDFAASLQAYSASSTPEALQGWMSQEIDTLSQEGLKRALEGCVHKRTILGNLITNSTVNGINVEQIQGLFEAYGVAMGMIKQKYKAL